MLPLYDPPREDSKATIEHGQKMGIKVKMVTGDQIAIAQETAGNLGLGTNIMDASVSFRTPSTIKPASWTEASRTADGFAQVFPEHKYHIVDVLQKHRPHRRHDRATA